MRWSQSQIAVVMIVLGMTFITFNDMMIKALSGDYPLYQIVFTRSLGGLFFSVLILQMEGGWHLLRTKTPVLHAVRAMMIVIANICFFLGIAVMPLGQVTALFFIAPILIALLSILVLGETVGRHRWAAICVGFLGVLVMLSPELQGAGAGLPWWTYALPLVAALAYAINQVMTRKLGVKSRASALAIYIQVTFLVVSALFYVIAGDGKFMGETENASLIFLLRPWVWPAEQDYWVFAVLGLNVAAVAYCLSQAYRMGDAGLIAPFEYVALPLAIFWGWWVFDEIPTTAIWAGIALIAGSGLYVVWRERKAAKAA